MSNQLSEVIRRVRQELINADDRRSTAGEAPLLKLDDVEIELTFVVVTNDKVKGGIDLKVVSLGAEKSLNQQEVHRVKLKLSTAEVDGSRAPRGARFKRHAGSAPSSEDEVESL